MRNGPSVGHGSVPAERPVWQFFALTFGFSWVAWTPSWMLMQEGLSPSPTIRASATIGQWLGGVGPSFAALVLVATDEGRGGVRALLQRAVRGRIGVWYLPALLIVPGTVVLAHLTNVALDGDFPRTDILSTPWMILPLFTVFLVMQVGEEFGWRGYALDRLQQRSSALGASLVLGAGWSAWHLPMFLVAGFPQFEHGVPFGHFAVTLITVSVLITWMQNGAGGSLVPAFLCHATVNLSGEVLPLWVEDGSGGGDAAAWVLANGLLIVCAAAVVRVAGARRLKRAPTRQGAGTANAPRSR